MVFGFFSKKTLDAPCGYCEAVISLNIDKSLLKGPFDRETYKNEISRFKCPSCKREQVVFVQIFDKETNVSMEDVKWQEIEKRQDTQIEELEEQVSDIEDLHGDEEISETEMSKRIAPLQKKLDKLELKHEKEYDKFEDKRINAVERAIDKYGYG